MIKAVRGFMLLVLLLPGVNLPAVAAAKVDHVPVARDLHARGQEARIKQIPVMLMFSAKDCAYCHAMKEDFLKPMLRSGDYDHKVIIRQVQFDAPETKLRDFDGDTTTVGALVSRYHVSVTPTLVFIDADGKPVAKKMVGLSTPDFFGGYLDSSIDTALQRVRRHTAAIVEARP